MNPAELVHQANWKWAPSCGFRGDVKLTRVERWVTCPECKAWPRVAKGVPAVEAAKPNVGRA